MRVACPLLLYTPLVVHVQCHVRQRNRGAGGNGAFSNSFAAINLQGGTLIVLADKNYAQYSIAPGHACILEIIIFEICLWCHYIV